MATAKKKTAKKKKVTKKSTKKNRVNDDDGLTVLEPQDLSTLDRANLSLHNAEQALKLHNMEFAEFYRVNEARRLKLESQVAHMRERNQRVVADIEAKYHVDLSQFSYDDETGVLKPNP